MNDGTVMNGAPKCVSGPPAGEFVGRFILAGFWRLVFSPVFLSEFDAPGPRLTTL